MHVRVQAREDRDPARGESWVWRILLDSSMIKIQRLTGLTLRKNKSQDDCQGVDLDHGVEGGARHQDKEKLHCKGSLLEVGEW